MLTLCHFAQKEEANKIGKILRERFNLSNQVFEVIDFDLKKFGFNFGVEVNQKSFDERLKEIYPVLTKFVAECPSQAAMDIVLF